MKEGIRGNNAIKGILVKKMGIWVNYFFGFTLGAT